MSFRLQKQRYKLPSSFKILYYELFFKLIAGLKPLNSTKTHNLIRFHFQSKVYCNLRPVFRRQNF